MEGQEFRLPGGTIAPHLSFKGIVFGGQLSTADLDRRGLRRLHAGIVKVAAGTATLGTPVGTFEFTRLLSPGGFLIYARIGNPCPKAGRHRRLPAGVLPLGVACQEKIGTRTTAGPSAHDSAGPAPTTWHDQNPCASAASVVRETGSPIPASSPRNTVTASANANVTGLNVGRLVPGGRGF